MRSTWTEFCEKLQDYAAPSGQQAAKDFLKWIHPLYESYKSYDLKKILEVFKGYIHDGRILVPQVNNFNYRSSLKDILNMCEELVQNGPPTMEQVNEFILIAHEIVVNALDGFIS